MSVFLLAIGLIFALVGVLILWDYITVVTSYEILPAKVSAFQTRYKRTSKGSSFMYYPVIEYVAYGNKKEFQAKSGASWPMYDIGEPVEVYYSKKYDDVRLKSVAMLIIGPAFILIGLGVSYLFWMNFEMTFFSLLYAVGVSGAIAWFFGTLMRKRGIKNMPDLTQKMRSLSKKVRHTNADDSSNLITKQSELLSSDLPGNKNIKFIGPLFTLVGLIVIGGAIYFGMQRWDFLERAELASGTVIDYRSSTDDDGTTYYPIVEFTPPYSSQPITFQHDVGSSNPSYSRGAVVPILFDPDNAGNAIIDEGLWNWFGPILMSVLGIAFFIVGGMLTRRWLKIKNYEKRKLQQPL